MTGRRGGDNWEFSEARGRGTRGRVRSQGQDVRLVQPLRERYTRSVPSINPTK
jgi:hypothetical protein